MGCIAYIIFFFDGLIATIYGSASYITNVTQRLSKNVAPAALLQTKNKLSKKFQGQISYP